MHGEISKKLFEESKNDVYRFSSSPFRLASGRESHHYFNCKKITLHPTRLAMLASALFNEIFPLIKEEFDAVGGLTLGADPIAYALALEASRNGKLIYPIVVRKEAKDHGTGERIEGELERIKRVVVLDDVVTTGGSTLKAVDALRGSGIHVESAVAILDREEGGREALLAKGVRLHTLFMKSDFLNKESETLP